MNKILRDRTKPMFAVIETCDLHWFVKQAKKEIHARWEDRRAFSERLAGAFAGMANVMAGVTWALACRDSLRRSKGHVPTGGKRPASGEMWLPREILTALRAEIKERRWSPLGAEHWGNVSAWLKVESQRHIGTAKRAEAEAKGMAVAQFKIPFAQGNCSLFVDPTEEQRH